MKFAVLAALLALPLAGRAQAGPSLALGNGEQLVYHVSWIVLPAGQIRVSAQAETSREGHPRLRITSTTSSRGLAYLLLPFKARAVSLFDPANGRLLSLSEWSDTRSRLASHTTVFDYADHRAEYTRTAPPAPTRALAMPPGNPTDLITCLLLARTWGLQPGQKRDALVLFDDDFYQLTVHALRREKVATELGEFDTVVLEPRMEETPPKGMFRRGSTVRVWISDDPRHLPVRFQVDFNFGYGVASLAEYRPPEAPR